MKRELYIVGDISYENYATFAEELSLLEQDNKKPIVVHLTSEGGDPYASLAYAERIRLSPCDIRVVGLGYVASAAVLILASGDWRVLSRESWVMLHEEFSKLSGSVSAKEVEIQQERALEGQCYRLLGEKTMEVAAHWQSLHKQTTYIGSNRALLLGLIDEII